MEVPSAVLLKLVCENCDGYLSRGPVHLMDNAKYRCGRCLPSKGEQGTRLQAYEKLAKLMTFPCRYRHNGCPSKVPFVENEVHEDGCPYREYICPVAESGQCEWTGIQTQLLEHCRQDHPDNVVENPCKFTHNITRSSTDNYLLWTFESMFFIQTKVCTATRTIYHSVRLLGDPARAYNYKYTLCIQNKDSGFYKQREVAPRGCLALQSDSSIQTDTNGLLAMLEDFTDTTFTVTVESAGNGTMESSTAEASSQGTSSSNVRNRTPEAIIEAIIACGYCQAPTEPVYRGGWMCRSHVPKWRPCKNGTKGCTYSDVGRKYEKHENYYCLYNTFCTICSEKIPSTMLDAHYTEAHGNITHRAGIVCTVGSVEFEWKYFIIDSDLGTVLCAYCFNCNFLLHVFTPLSKEQLHKYRCALEVSHPDTGHTLTCTPVVRYDRPCDWFVQVLHTDFKTYSKNKMISIKINFTKLKDPSEIIL